MGRDKALIPFLGRPLIERVLERLSPLADEILVTTNRPEDYRYLGLPLAGDAFPGRGALGGLYTALHAAGQPLVAVAACDMPFASAALFDYLRLTLLRTGSNAAIPRTAGGTEPFHAVYDRQACLPLILAALQADLWRVDAWFPQAAIYFLAPEEMQPYDAHGLAFANVNTPEELAAAEERARRIER